MIIALILMVTMVYASAENNYGTVKASRMQFIGTGIGIYSVDVDTGMTGILQGIEKVSIAIGDFPARIREYQPTPKQPGLLESNMKVREYIDVRRRGLLKLGEQKYGLNQLVKNTGSWTGNVYSSPSKDAELVGTLTLTKTEKTSEEKPIWTGTLTINNTEIGLYVTMKKTYTVKELNQKIKNYCLLTENGSTQCLWLKEQPKNYCEKHPNTEKCQELTLEYCKKNAETDSKCVKVLEEYCKKTTNTEKPEFCITEKIENTEYIGIKQEKIKEVKNITPITTQTTTNAWWIETTETNNKTTNQQNQGIEQN